MAFRHPSTNDPFCMTHLIWKQLPQCAKQQGVRLESPTHFHFIYDRGIPLWAGAPIGWLYANLGGSSIHRGKVDWVGLRSARHLFANGRFPMAAAPEGATNGHNEIISPLEPGIAQLAFWCVEDLKAAGRSETVEIVPIGIQYRYVEPQWDAVASLLAQLEADAGLSQDDPLPPLPFDTVAFGSDRQATLYRRLYRLGGHLLGLMEGFYRQFYNRDLPERSLPQSNAELGDRIQTLLDTALHVAEQYFGVPSKGSVVDRCRRLEQAGWDRIYRQELKQPESISALERGLADRVAEESALRMWHMRLVETFTSVTGQYVLENPSAERFADTTLLIWDMMCRIKGGNPFARPQLGSQQVRMTVEAPISASDRWEEYCTNRRSAKRAIGELTKDLQGVLEQTIH